MVYAQLLGIGAVLIILAVMQVQGGVVVAQTTSITKTIVGTGTIVDTLAQSAGQSLTIFGNYQQLVTSAAMGGIAIAAFFMFVLPFVAGFLGGSGERV